MNQHDLVSIVLPTHNGFRYLAQSIDSCLRQTYSDLELVIVDDGSSDNTKDLVCGYDDPRIHYVRHEKNQGLPESLNTGFALTSGAFLSWTSDDNLYSAQAIEIMVSALKQHDEVGLVYSAYALIDASGTRVGQVDALPPARIWDADVVGASFLYTREVYEKTGRYNPDVKPIEDYEYWLRVSRGFRMLAIPDVLYSYRAHQASLSGNLNGLERARKVAQLKFRLGGISRKRLVHELATIDLADAFEHYRIGDFARVPTLIARGLSRTPRYALNRGIWSIMAKSLMRMPAQPNR